MTEVNRSQNAVPEQVRSARSEDPLPGVVLSEDFRVRILGVEEPRLVVSLVRRQRDVLLGGAVGCTELPVLRVTPGNLKLDGLERGIGLWTDLVSP